MIKNHAMIITDQDDYCMNEIIKSTVAYIIGYSIVGPLVIKHENSVFSQKSVSKTFLMLTPQ